MIEQLNVIIVLVFLALPLIDLIYFSSRKCTSMDSFMILFLLFSKYIVSFVWLMMYSQDPEVSTVDEFKSFIIVSGLSFAFQFLMIYLVFGLKYEHTTEDRITQLQTTKYRIYRFLFNGKRVILTEFLVLLWSHSLIYNTLDPEFYNDIDIVTNPSGKLKRLLMYSLVSIIAVGYLLANIRNRSENLKLIKIVSPDNSEDKKSQKSKVKTVVIHLINALDSFVFATVNMYAIAVIIIIYSVHYNYKDPHHVTQYLPIIELISILLYSYHTLRLISRSYEKQQLLSINTNKIKHQ
ncbi:hypothetical protein DLAC_08127 [Tieghemostelium lacteum]|uniref:Uncharacterized protein n=1 Tax=Tieghemostelium lacteum TaxID=361077 RepID=A0A151ZBE4_TIELA|nr:hypothetical protein DLAC_08127 [Tieghemostelium lacteum]|eukprot:KYQ91204.1 hypothetical protein DLAC_08127 [Tieghemostelium lacteum]